MIARILEIVLRVVMLGMIASCGRIDFDPIAARLADGNVATCTFGPWSAPQPVAELETTSNDWGGQITGDGLALYFNSDRSGPSKIFVATRPDRSTPFGTAVDLTELSSAAEGNPSVTGDQLEIYFDSDRGAGYAIYSATRPDTASMWQNITRLAALYLTTDVDAAYITPDGLTLFYQSGTAGTTQGDLLVTTRATRTDTFAAGTPVPGITGAYNGTPALSADQLTLYFQSGMSTDELNLYQASRPDVTSPFGAATLVSVSISGSQDADPSITADGLELFFASDRQGSVGGADLYVATRACL